MEVFTAIGIMLTVMIICTLWFLITCLLLDESVAPYMAYISIVFFISLLLATFITNPEHYGYQRVSLESEVDK